LFYFTPLSNMLKFGGWSCRTQVCVKRNREREEIDEDPCVSLRGREQEPRGVGGFEAQHTHTQLAFFARCLLRTPFCPHHTHTVRACVGRQAPAAAFGYFAAHAGLSYISFTRTQRRHTERASWRGCCSTLSDTACTGFTPDEASPGRLLRSKIR
jgi:hypothetical protein